jgi:hypothetical protein
MNPNDLKSSFRAWSPVEPVNELALEPVVDLLRLVHRSNATAAQTVEAEATMRVEIGIQARGARAECRREYCKARACNKQRR